MSLSLSSPAFSANSMLPIEYTCNGEGVSPPLAWEGVPLNTKSFALIVDDPDAPGGLWTHWLLFNIPSELRQLATATAVPEGAMSAKISWGSTGYGAPCPPSGTHRYVFKLYALDTVLSLDEHSNEEDVLMAMQQHILEQNQLIGLYSKR